MKKHTPQEIYREALKERASSDSLRKRQACEKGWLAVTEAVDAFLAQHNKHVPKGTGEAHVKRQQFLGELSEIDTEAYQIIDLVSQVADQLHGGCFYGGIDIPHYDTVLKQTVRKILELTGYPLDGDESDK